MQHYRTIVLVCQGGIFERKRVGRGKVVDGLLQENKSSGFTPITQEFQVNADSDRSYHKNLVF
jgi:hypothetical protein